MHAVTDFAQPRPVAAGADQPSVAAGAGSRQLLAVAVVLVVCVHGALLLLGSWERTYDAYVHLFLADHYTRDWFSTWEPRWYTGFTVTSYPPGAHMALALAGRAVGLTGAYPLVQIGILVLGVLGVYRFSRLWVEDRAAGWAAILFALSPAVAETVHVFGQLPTTVGAAFTLNALPSVRRWVTSGHRGHLIVALACAGAATAAHHVTTLFGSVFFVGPVVALALIERFRHPRPGEPTGHSRWVSRHTIMPMVARRLRRILRPAVRAAVYGVGVLLTLALVVLPYWLWSQNDPIVQIPIPHGSRENFLVNRDAGLVFWLVPWGPAVLLALPYAVVRGLRTRAWPLAASVCLLLVLGLGGTTPIAQALLGGAFDILTLDRFTIWATIAVLPLVGAVVVALLRERRRLLVSVGAVTVVASMLFAATLTRYRPFQPPAIDPGPIAEFLAKDDHDDWRYLMLGFGDQMAWVSAQTTAATVDGNYHSARRLPELTTRGVERLEGAKYRGVPGLGSLQQFLVRPEPTSLKFVFSADRFYDPLLHFSGWQLLGTLENGVQVWERPDVPPLPEVLPRRELPAWQRGMWGLLPPTVLLGGLLCLVALPLLARFGPGRASRLLRRIDAALAVRARRVAVDEKPVQWQVWRPPMTWLRVRLRGVGQHVCRAAAAATVLLILLAGASALRTPVASPDEVVTAYLEALDVRRFEAAHALLDPVSRPSLDQYRLIRSVDGGGLRASYTLLDDVEPLVTEVDGSRATVHTRVRWVSALAVDEQVETYALRRRAGKWRILLDDVDLTVPADQLVRHPTVEYFRGNRRAVTTRTDQSDLLDRPRLGVTSTRLVRHEDRWSVVGEVANLDADPAAATLTGQLLDATGRVLTTWNGGQHAPHTLRPGEAAPFRIDFEGVAGAAAQADLSAAEFDPQGWTPPVLPAGAIVTGHRVYAQALVTTRGLGRPVAADDVVVQVRDEQIEVTGRIRGIGDVEATVPMITVAAHARDGSVVWVESTYLSDSVTPQRARPFQVTLPALGSVQPVPRAGQVFTNGRVDTPVTSALIDSAVPVRGVPGVAGVTVRASSFVRDA